MLVRSSFVPVVVVDHTQVIGVCASCHDGAIAIGKSATHIQSTDICDACHNTVAFVPVTVVDHNEVLGSCSTCHDGTIATGKGNQHFLYSGGQNCDACHTTNSWINVDYNHTVYYPGDHAAFSSRDCARCHEKSETVKQGTYPSYPMTCAGCHADKFSPSDHDDTPRSTAVDCSSSNCHKTSPEHSVSANNW